MFICFNAIPTVAKAVGEPVPTVVSGEEFAAILASIMSGDSVVQDEIPTEIAAPEEGEGEQVDVAENECETDRSEEAEPELPEAESLEIVPVQISMVQSPLPEKAVSRQFIPGNVGDVTGSFVPEQAAETPQSGDQTVPPSTDNVPETLPADVPIGSPPDAEVEVAQKTDSKSPILPDTVVINTPHQTRETSAPKQVFHAVEVADVNEKVMIAIRSQDDGTTELALSPDELGKVTVKVTTQDQDVHVLVTTERPEAEGLVRRQIETLVQDLKNQGFSNIAFEFGSRSQGNPQSAPPDTHVVATSEEPDVPLVPTRPAPMIDGRIDIRL